MKADIFLYGRTATHDYLDMYIPSWLQTDSAEYREYRKAVSFIMKIRDILPESRFNVLEKTGDSFMFIQGSSVSMLCRFCHICGSDQFGRPVCSTEGFIVKNESLREFWKLIPDAVSFMTAGSTYYAQYMEKCTDESRPVPESRTESVEAGMVSYPSTGQFAELKNAADKCSRPFSFAYGNGEKSLYSYGTPEDSVSINAFFCADECTEIPDEPEITTEAEADFGCLVPFVMITRTQQGRLKYKTVLVRDDSVKSRDSIAYESYERETGTEIKVSELFRMHAALSEYISRNGADEKTKRKAVPFSSDTDAEYTGKITLMEYCPPAQQKRSFMQMIRGEKLPCFAEGISLKTEDGGKKLSDISEIMVLSDDSSSVLVSYEKIMEAAF